MYDNVSAKDKAKQPEHLLKCRTIQPKAPDWEHQNQSIKRIMEIKNEVDCGTHRYIKELLKEICDTATSLRCQLEDLANEMQCGDFSITASDEFGNVNEYDDYDIQDFADSVSEIEQLFEY